ncbi:MAG TPA: hypothetical protein VLJ18_06775 [Thermoanaerobaculia bacterium]|nr:hypothetical protein [Thermoanaerobaculia bacterium]
MRTVLIVLALLAITVVAVLWLLPPPAPRRSVREKCRLDDIVPEFQFGEFHERFVRSSPEAVDHAIRSVPADEILLFRTLTFLRNPARLFGRQKENILNPPVGKPILEVATRSGFVMLSDEPGREIVLGTLVARPAGVRIAVSGDTAATARRFAELSAPGYAKAATNFRIEPRPDGSCRLTTETRIFATDRVTARRFATYWRFILPGSSLLRVTWLRAIADRAESRR